MSGGTTHGEGDTAGLQTQTGRTKDILCTQSHRVQMATAPNKINCHVDEADVEKDILPPSRDGRNAGLESPTEVALPSNLLSVEKL